jgi:hypothetical protein
MKYSYPIKRSASLATEHSDSKLEKNHSNALLIPISADASRSTLSVKGFGVAAGRGGRSNGRTGKLFNVTKDHSAPAAISFL